MYQGGRPGTYVATIAVGGRRGAWFTGDELRELIGKVDLYLEAGKVYHDHSSLKTPAQRRRREKKLIEYTKRVDGRYYRHGSEAPVYTLGDNARPKIEELRRKIQHLASLARPQIPLIQAPLLRCLLL
ncbi:hypothetical protein PG987_011768 [Apiospora arundinis]